MTGKQEPSTLNPKSQTHGSSSGRAWAQTAAKASTRRREKTKTSSKGKRNMRVWGLRFQCFPSFDVSLGGGVLLRKVTHDLKEI